MDQATSLRLSSGNSQNSHIHIPAPNVFLVACLPGCLPSWRSLMHHNYTLLCFPFPFFLVHMWLQFVRQSLPTRASVEFRRSSVRLFRQYNVSCRASTLQELYGNHNLCGNSLSSLPNLTNAFECYAWKFLGCAFLNAFFLVVVLLII